METFQFLWIKEILILQAFHCIALNQSNNQTYSYITWCKRKPLFSSKDPRPNSNSNGRKVFITKQWLFYYSNAISHFLHQCFGSPLPNSQSASPPAYLCWQFCFGIIEVQGKKTCSIQCFLEANNFTILFNNYLAIICLLYQNFYYCFLCFSFDFKPIESKQLKCMLSNRKIEGQISEYDIVTKIEMVFLKWYKKELQKQK